MTGTEKTAELIKDINNTIKVINDTYGKVLNEIAELQQELDNIQETCKDRSKEFIEEKTAKIRAKIEKKTQAAQKYIENKTQEAQDFLDEKKKEILKRILDSKLAMTFALGLGAVKGAMNAAQDNGINLPK